VEHGRRVNMDQRPRLSLDDPELESVLPAHLPGQRWFGSKNHEIIRIRVLDSIPIAGGLLKVVEVGYRDADPEVYALPVAAAGDALRDPAFVRGLVRAVERGERFPGRAGELVAFRTGTFAEPDWSAAAAEEPRVAGTEQSNSSVFLGERLILKLYRRLLAGVNPDLEVSEFLTVAGFPNAAPVAGGLTYRPAEGDAVTVAMLQAFVPNCGDAWAHALGLLERGADYAPFASLLGRRTAELHVALAGDAEHPDFAPEPTTATDAAAALDDIVALAGDALAMLRGKLPELGAEDRRVAAEVLAGERRLLGHVDDLAARPIAAMRIRCHGDYHLGQLLFTGDDFVIVDFEGEPARPLAERRARRWATKDVAGMLRSFAYAATTAGGGEAGARWERAAGEAFLDSYWAAAGDAPFVPSSGEERRLLVDAMLVEKALYELRYELNNRPDWVRIPLRGLHALLAA
jgi:1,4-alpha-glucan branching enzyme